MLSRDVGRVAIAEQYQIASVDHRQTLRIGTAGASGAAIVERYRIGAGAVGGDSVSTADLMVTGIAIEIDTLVTGQVAAAVGNEEAGSSERLEGTGDEVSREN